MYCPSARPDWVLDQTFDLFVRLDANDAQLDFPVIYCSALEGWASVFADQRESDMTALFQAITDYVPPPNVAREGPFHRYLAEDGEPEEAADHSRGWATDYRSVARR